MGFSNDNDDEKTSIVPSDTFQLRVKRAVKTPPCLVVLTGPSDYIGKQWLLEKRESVIGRIEEAGIHIPDDSLSRMHAKINLNTKKFSEVSITDLDSTNKTLLNGKELKPFESGRLKNNDHIQMGNIIFKFLSKGNIEIIAAQDSFNKAMRDPLTGILNKGALNAQAKDFFKKASVLNKPLSVILLDVDHFKKINDEYGHSGGDYVLKELVKVTRGELIRKEDVFARWGGEEFCVLALGSPSGHSREIAERIRFNLERHIFEYEKKRISVTVSLGVAARQKEDQSWEEIFERADKALYESKRHGRNRVTLAA